MKTRAIFFQQKIKQLLLSFMMIIMTTTSCLSQNRHPEMTSIPYFEVVPKDATEVLPLKSTDAIVDIAGVIALVTVRQTYRNTGNKAIEAVYVFPGSTRAAIHAMKMKIGERIIIAKIEEREKARNDYTRAINDGHMASLLEQERPNVFRMNVGNIMPGDLVEVELQYTENLVSIEGVYEFIYPTVVGPRYSGINEDSYKLPEWNANPFLPEGELPASKFNLECNITSGIPLKNVRCTSHKVNIDYSDKKSATIRLDESTLHGGNKDFILHYRLGGNGIESGLWLYNDGVENYFMATIQPPDVVRPEMIPPREYIFIVDVSGSMYGFPLDVSKKLIGEILNGLKTTDCFNILLFAGGNNMFSEKSVRATSSNINQALRMLDSQSGSGGTELLPALKKALSMELSDNFARTFVIATDGYVTIEKEAFSLIKSNLGKASFFAFGIGTSVNRYLIEGLAHAGAGEAFIITNENEASVKAPEFLKYISTPVLTDIAIAFDGFDAFDVEPSSLPDIFSSRPVVVFGKYRGNPQGNISLSGFNGNGKYYNSISLNSFKPLPENLAVKYLWAREKIRMLDDYSGGYNDKPDQSKEIVTKLGIQYNLLTAYTSFVAIDSNIRNAGGKYTTIRQPLPLPEGVSNFAVGTSISGISSPKTKRDAKAMGYAVSENIDSDVSESEVFTVVESKPEFPGGEKALKQFLKKNLVYPEGAIQLSGKVVVQFNVNTDGSLSDIRVVNSLGFGYDEEAIRLIKLMPAWIPGKHRGKNVQTSLTLPIQF